MDLLSVNFVVVLNHSDLLTFFTGLIEYFPDFEQCEGANQAEGVSKSSSKTEYRSVIIIAAQAELFGWIRYSIRLQLFLHRSALPKRHTKNSRCAHMPKNAKILGPKNMIQRFSGSQVTWFTTK